MEDTEARNAAFKALFDARERYVLPPMRGTKSNVRGATSTAAAARPSGVHTRFDSSEEEVSEESLDEEEIPEILNFDSSKKEVSEESSDEEEIPEVLDSFSALEKQKQRQKQFRQARTQRAAQRARENARSQNDSSQAEDQSYLSQAWNWISGRGEAASSSTAGSDKKKKSKRRLVPQLRF